MLVYFIFFFTGCTGYKYFIQHPDDQKEERRKKEGRKEGRKVGWAHSAISNTHAIVTFGSVCGWVFGLDVTRG